MLYCLDNTAPDTPFPHPERALREPAGLLAVGGDLSVQRLLNAYRHGIFPWYSHGQPLLWWSPNPRLVLFPERLHIARSLAKTLRRATLQVTRDQAFTAVIRACAGPRHNAHGTWLVPAMVSAYECLHQQQWAHSIEVWENGVLVGGLYGVALGHVFFGESMFSRRPDASKVAFVHLVQYLITQHYQLIDCQVRTEHLLRLGAELIPRRTFLRLLEQGCTVADPVSFR